MTLWPKSLDFHWSNAFDTFVAVLIISNTIVVGVSFVQLQQWRWKYNEQFYQFWWHEHFGLNVCNLLHSTKFHTHTVHLVRWIQRWRQNLLNIYSTWKAFSKMCIDFKQIQMLKFNSCTENMIAAKFIISDALCHVPVFTSMVFAIFVLCLWHLREKGIRSDYINCSSQRKKFCVKIADGLYAYTVASQLH